MFGKSLRRGVAASLLSALCSAPAAAGESGEPQPDFVQRGELIKYQRTIAEQQGLLNSYAQRIGALEDALRSQQTAALPQAAAPPAASGTARAPAAETEVPPPGAKPYLTAICTFPDYVFPYDRREDRAHFYEAFEKFVRSQIPTWNEFMRLHAKMTDNEGKINNNAATALAEYGEVASEVMRDYAQGELKAFGKGDAERRLKKAAEDFEKSCKNGCFMSLYAFDGASCVVVYPYRTRPDGYAEGILAEWENIDMSGLSRQLKEYAKGPGVSDLWKNIGIGAGAFALGYWLGGSGGGGGAGAVSGGLPADVIGGAW